MNNLIAKRALEYHRFPIPGKLEITATKPLATQQDLSYAYSPGVAEACNEIRQYPAAVSDLTIRGNLVAVVTNGTAVLGLGNIGPSAAKPVMEGKAVLFKKFSGIDVFDIEIDATDPQRFCDIVASLEPTFGAINLEDIKAPECFEIESSLRQRMSIPVFHDDQHGTAIIVAAAIKNALHIVGKTIEQIRVVTSGAGAAAIACLNLLTVLGVRKQNIIVTDMAGVIYKGRSERMDQWKEHYAVDTNARTLDEVIDNADVFLGLSVADVLSQDQVKRMASSPVILALANPTPEILPEEVKQARADAIVATGRSDYPNQVNNVLCFPFIFRGALDVGATEINSAMELACVDALANLAMQRSSDIVAQAYGSDKSGFGPDKIIPKPFDPRLLSEIAPAVARAAMDSGVATRPIKDFDAYYEQLTTFVFRSGLVMKPIFERARSMPKRVIYAEGEERVVLHAVQDVIEQGIAKPILVGRAEVIRMRMDELGLAMRPNIDVELVDLLQDRRFKEYWSEYHRIMGRMGVSPAEAKIIVRTRATVVAALAIRLGDADAMICGTVGNFGNHLRHVRNIIGTAEGVHDLTTMAVLVLKNGTFFICDTHVASDPDAAQIAAAALLASKEVRAFGIEPKVALLSRSNFGSFDSPASSKMRDAVELIRELAPTLEVDGEMHADTALSEQIRRTVLPDSCLSGQANLFVMPNVDAANISYNLLKMLGGGVTVGPLLLGTARPAHVLTHSTTVRGLIDVTAIAVVNANRF